MSVFATSLKHFAAATIVFSVAIAGAEPPAVSSLYPTGVQRGTSAELNVNGKPGSAPVSVWCDREGVTVTPSEKGEKLAVSIAEETSPGLCWLRLYNKEGASDLIPLMIGLLPELNEAEPNNELEQATQIEALPAVANGTLHRSGEVDAFAFYLDAGETLIASVRANSAFGSPMDPVLQLVSPEGFVLEQNDDHHGFDPQIEFTADRLGRYFVRIFAFPAEPNSSINFAGGPDYVYRLSLTTGPFVDHLSPVKDSVTEGDLSTDACGWNLDSGEIDVTSLPGLHLALPTVDISAFSTADSQNGEAPVEFTSPARLIGHILEPDEIDSVYIRVKKGDQLRIRVRSRSFESPLDPVLEISDSDGKQVAESDDASRGDFDIDRNWSPSKDGLYRISITDRFGHGGMRFVYHLLIEPDQPRCELSIDADHFVLKADKPLEIPVTVSRDGGFDKELTITALDLPEGIRVTEAVSKSKGDSSRKVTLKLQAEKAEPFNGPIRIVARASDESDLEIIASTRTRAAGLRTTSFWLTHSP